MKADFSKRVLIADNESDTVESLRIVLSGYGYETLTAANGEEAIAVAKETSPDAIILDVAMPKVDGFEVSKRLRSIPNLAETVIVGVSGFGQKEFVDRAKDAGMDFYLLKPAEIEELVSCLNSKLKTS